ncbi:HlyD family efflux transporter periplasmic adaptor subunit [Pseudomonas sp. 5P_3.1_Bac2]|uniref:HlyD family efflux transporter periplasmic adaptor subunit n=1 Tax=Pseudomonas sp. 5P_3.1_Bac2 TaxID=2971617 RepID=UPI0021C7EC6F|nr:HlyD family efflux transporter periplasmic adaptor subunit [Pseudomonas sp. 5P_3.1_Bac2]MCU1717250.1 biotin/lipoyl-binding protein [Pseudomonas sp. 5P_3.1_Bac2]
MTLPALRPDLQLSPGAPGLDGAPQWTLADPLRGRYFKLGAPAMRLLRHWALGDAQRVLQAANGEPGLPVQEQALEELLRFLRGHDLVSAVDSEQRASYATKAAAQRQGLWTQILHKYLFFRIPLWRPDAFLNRTWPWLERYGLNLLRFGLPTVLLLGMFLVMRDWPRFLATFPHLLSLGGAVAFAIALGFAKLAHEFGHAYMAKRAGCRVPSMGVAFMVLLPMLYTDVSDAWRVQDRRTRLLIGAGGMLAELVLACMALLAWSLLPDGAGRTAAFMLASATWITTLLINVNPLMRFDGYFLLSDLWGVDNLQGRGFALGRWYLREKLFGYGEPMPERWSPQLRRRLLLWSYAAWLWRAVLFLGIALAVYHLFFKVLGIFLMMVELVWFLGLPVWREMQHWWQHRSQAQPGKVLALGSSLVLLLLLLIVPWRSSVEVPALLEAAQVSAVHAPTAARVREVLVSDGQQVAAGQVLLHLQSPDLEARLSISRREIEILQLQLRRQSGRTETAADSGILEQRLAEAVAEYRGLAQQRERLTLRAPHAGVVRDLANSLWPGRWVGSELALAQVAESGVRLHGYLAEADLWRVEAGSTGHFVADDVLRQSLAVTLRSLDVNGVAFIDQEALISDNQGPIAIRRDVDKRAQPLQAQYGAQFVVDDDSGQPLSQPVRGLVVLRGKAESLWAAAWRRMAAIGVRESGF